MTAKNKRVVYDIKEDNGKLGYVYEYPDKTIHHTSNIRKLGGNILLHGLRTLKHPENFRMVLILERLPDNKNTEVK